MGLNIRLTMRTRWRDYSRPRSYLLLISTPAGTVVDSSNRGERLEVGLNWVKRCGQGLICLERKGER